MPVDQMICVAGGERVRLSDDVIVSVYPSQHSLRVVADADDPVRRGVPRRPRRHVAGAAGSGCASSRTYLATALDPERVRAPARRRRSGTATAATAARWSTCSRRPRARCSTRTRRATGAGSSTALRPDVAILAAAGRGNVDGEPIQGSLAEFVGRPGRALVRPPALVLGHHDDWLPGFSVPTDMAPLRAAFARRRPGQRAARTRLPRRYGCLRLTRNGRGGRLWRVPRALRLPLRG